MSSICGIARTNGTPLDPPEIEAMLDALDHWRADDRGVWSDRHVALGHLMLHNTPESLGETQPFHDPATGLVITADARIDNRYELASLLGIARGELGAWPDSRLILAAYRRWGDGCVRRLLGDFAFAVWDPRRRRLVCARDTLGVKPLYYAEARGALAFATEIKGLLALTRVDRALDETWIADFVCRILIECDRTLYRHIRILEPGHVLVLESGHVGRRKAREVVAPPELRLATAGEYVEAFRERFDRAVARRLRSAFPIGAELSGGLDSSGICALAHRLLGEQGQEIRTYSQVLPDAPPELELPPDERGSVEAVLAFAGIARAHLQTGEGRGLQPVLERARAVYDEPPRVTVGLFKDEMFERAQEEGVRVLLSGFGGNQCVTSSGGGLGLDLLRGRRWGPMLAELTSAGRRDVFAGIREALVVRKTPLGRVVGRWNGRDAHIVHQKLEHRPLRADVFTRLDLPARAGRYVERWTESGTMVERAIRRLTRPDVPARLQYGHLAAASWRMEFRYPMLDLELVEFVLSLPPRMKRRRGTGRLIYRMALEGRVPDEVRLHAGGASANPGAILRRHEARAGLERQLNALPPTHRLFDYVDRDKLGGEIRIDTTAGPVRWRRMLVLMTLLILEAKLADAP